MFLQKILSILLNPPFVRGVLWFLAVATPAAGAILVTWIARPAPGRDVIRRRRILTQNPLFWVVSASGPLLGILWIVFNAIENLLGLDSIAGFLVNLGLFGAVGFGLSLFLWYGRYWLRRPRRHAAPAAKKQP